MHSEIAIVEYVSNIKPFELQKNQNKASIQNTLIALHLRAQDASPVDENRVQELLRLRSRILHFEHPTPSNKQKSNQREICSRLKALYLHRRLKTEIQRTGLLVLFVLIVPTTNSVRLSLKMIAERETSDANSLALTDCQKDDQIEASNALKTLELMVCDASFTPSPSIAELMVRWLHGQRDCFLAEAGCVIRCVDALRKTEDSQIEMAIVQLLAKYTTAQLQPFFGFFVGVCSEAQWLAEFVLGLLASMPQAQLVSHVEVLFGALAREDLWTGNFARDCPLTLWTIDACLRSFDLFVRFCFYVDFQLIGAQANKAQKAFEKIQHVFFTKAAKQRPDWLITFKSQRLLLDRLQRLYNLCMAQRGHRITKVKH